MARHRHRDHGVNGGTLVMDSITQLGPTGVRANRTGLNGGELKTFATITVPSQSASPWACRVHVSYQGGSTTNLQDAVTGAGGNFTIASIGYANFDQST